MSRLRGLWRLPARAIAFFFHDPGLFLKFIAVGAASAILEFTLFNLLYTIAGMALLVANSVAIAITLVFHFNVQRRWTFRDSSGLRRQLTWYLVMNTISALLNNLLVYVFVVVLLLPPALAKLLQIGLLFGWNFTFSRLVVFARRS